jgi:hypothetical protein
LILGELSIANERPTGKITQAQFDRGVKDSETAEYTEVRHQFRPQIELPTNP